MPQRCKVISVVIPLHGHQHTEEEKRGGAVVEEGRGRGSGRAAAAVPSVIVLPPVTGRQEQL